MTEDGLGKGSLMGAFQLKLESDERTSKKRAEGRLLEEEAGWAT